VVELKKGESVAASIGKQMLTKWKGKKAVTLLVPSQWSHRSSAHNTMWGYETCTILNDYADMRGVDLADNYTQYYTMTGT
jgi:hypothetical protein